MRYLSLFSGIEACGIWKDRLGWEPVAFAEIEPFPCAALVHHYPDVPNLGNIMDITDDQIAALGHIDVVVGGSPCQDLSIAGKRQGMTKDSGTRSSLFHHQIRIFDAARKHNGARFLLWENVPGAFSSNKRADFAAVVGEMVGTYPTVPKKWEKEGLAIGPNGLVEWCVLDAQWRGLAQRRKRVFALLDTGDWASRPPILLEPKSLSGDTPPSREAGEIAAGTLEARSTGCFGIDEECNVTDDHFGPLLRGGQGGTRQSVHIQRGLPLSEVPGGELGDVVADVRVVRGDSDVAHTLKGDGFDGSEDGTGRGTPIVPVIATGEPPLLIRMREGKDGGGKGPLISENVSLTIATSNDQVLAYRVHGEHSTAMTGNGVARVADPTELARCLDTCGGYSANQGGNVVMAYRWQNDADGIVPDEVASTLRANGTTTDERTTGAYVQQASMQVRRLTPVECARLQGFPDDYLSQVVWKKKAPADGVQYKALGNSMARNVMLYIGQRIEWALSHG